jgi:hypothetical protein
MVMLMLMLYDLTYILVYDYCVFSYMQLLWFASVASNSVKESEINIKGLESLLLSHVNFISANTR